MLGGVFFMDSIFIDKAIVWVIVKGIMAIEYIDHLIVLPVDYENDVNSPDNS